MNNTSRPIIAAYIAGVGMAVIVTIVDGMMNNDASAMQKFGAFITVLLRQDLSSKGFYALCSLLFFGLVAALMVFINSPLSKKDAAVYGASILVALNLVPQTGPKGAAASTGIGANVPNAIGAKGHDNGKPTSSEGPSDTGSGASTSGGGASNGGSSGQESHSIRTLVGMFLGAAPALAQSPTVTDATTTLWVVVGGIANYAGAQTLYQVRTVTNNLVASVRGKSAALFTLRPGDYFIQVDHPGYRSMIFPLTARGSPTAFSVRAEKSWLDSFENAFGPKPVVATREDSWAPALSQALYACQEGDRSGADDVIKRTLALYELLDRAGLMKPTICLTIFGY